MKFKTNIFLLPLVLGLSILSVTKAYGQKNKSKSVSVTNKDKESRAKTTRSKSGPAKRKSSDDYWMIGIGGNVVDDDGSPFKKLFNAGPRWNAKPYPTRLTLERSLKNSLSIEGAFNFNLYKPNKIINNEVGRAGIFLSGDLNLKNDFNKMFKLDGWFNPYVIYGAGTTYRTVRILPIGGNLNIGFGFNLWLSRSFGFNFQSIAKFGISPTRFLKTSSNYLQHSTGIVIKIHKGKKSFNKRRYKWIHRSNIGRERL